MPNSRTAKVFTEETPVGYGAEDGAAARRRLISRQPLLPWLVLKQAEGKLLSEWSDEVLYLVSGYWFGRVKMKAAGWRTLNHWYRKAHAEMVRRKLCQ